MNKFHDIAGWAIFWTAWGVLALIVALGSLALWVQFIRWAVSL